MTAREIVKPMDGFCFCTYDGMDECYRSALDVLRRQVPGAFVECGVAAGGMAGCFAKAMLTAGDLRPFHLFDSFVGIPIAGPRDDCQPGIGPKIADDQAPLRERLRPSGIGPATSVEQVKTQMHVYGLDDVEWIYHEGWFQDTLPTDAAALGPIALLHLDGDLYESTLPCLEWLWPLVSPGGTVLVDDYALTGPRLAVEDYFKGTPPPILPWADYGSAKLVKP